MNWGNNSTALGIEASEIGASDFQSFQHNCDRVLVEFIALADPALASRAQSVRRRLWNERLKVLVVGEFSRGKSTLINALIGEPILPSKVNPTTATINIVTGEAPRRAIVNFVDGSSEVLDLPSEHVNRFLDGVVTTSNRQATTIRVVKIQVPGRLSRLQVDIIDTPGVNDLDEVREEITFGFLRNADAAIVMLDAQQPLSDSERTFLREKIFNNDVRRVIFVVNKIDEVLSGGSLEDIPRILAFIRLKLATELSIPEPIVHGVSAKSALRARFRNEPDCSPVPFEEFETALVRFAAHEATNGRLQIHIDQLIGLILDQRAVVNQRVDLSVLESGEVEKQLTALVCQDECFRVVNARLLETLELECDVMARAIEDECVRQIEALQIAITSAFQACLSARDIDRFRAELANRLRELVENVERYAWDERSRVRRKLEDEFCGQLGGAALTARAFTSSVQPRSPVPSWPDLQFDQTPLRAESFIQSLSDPGADSFGKLLFELLNRARDIVDRVFISSTKKEARAAAIAQQELEQALGPIRTTCARVIERAHHVGLEIARREVYALSAQLRDRADRRSEGLRCTAQHARERGAMSRQQRADQRRDLEDHLQRLDAMEERCRHLTVQV